MYDFVPYLSFLTSGIGFLFILYILVRFNRFPKSYWLIGIIGSLVYMEFYIFGLTSKYIYQLLFLFRSSNIIRAFLPVLLLFYVRNMLFPNQQINKWEYLHFIFPILVTIGIMPDLMLSDADKIKILDNYYQHNQFLLMSKAGMIPPGVVQPVSIVMGLLYSIISFGLPFYAQNKFGGRYTYYNKQNLLWLKLVCAAIFLYFLLQLYQYLNLFMNHTFNPPSQIMKCVIGILLFSYFIGTPNVQENMDGCIIPPNEESHSFVPTIDEIKPILLTEFENNEIAKGLIEKMEEEKCFLSESCDLNSIAKTMGTTPQKLSGNIKKYFGVSFTEYINRLKIYHFLTHFNQFNHYTLEANIYQSGFKNRSTFYAAFKKYVGINPSFYLKEKTKEI